MTTHASPLNPAPASAGLAGSGVAASQPPVPAIPEGNLDAPSALGIMAGFPPPPENQVTPQNVNSPRFMRWAMTHASMMCHVARVSRGSGPVNPWQPGPTLDVETLAVEDGDNGRVAVPEIFRRTGLDAMIVTHRGKVVYERYLGDMRPNTLHMAVSITKSFVGTLVAMYAAQGALDLQARADHYLPELAGSSIGSATLEQLLDMRCQFRFGDQVHGGGALQLSYLQTIGLVPRPPSYDGPESIYAWLQSAQPAGAHGGAFRYENGCTETLGWILRRVTGKWLVDLMSEHFWAPLGMEQDADMIVDFMKGETAAGGLVACVRDLARFGELMRCEGTAQGRQLVPAAVVAAIRAGGDRDAFAQSPAALRRPGGSYRYQWWINHDELGSFQANGQFGQRIWVAPGAETVIAQFSVDPDPSNSREPLRLAMYRAIAEALR